MEQDYKQKIFFTRSNIFLLAGGLLATVASLLLALIYCGAFPISLSDIFSNSSRSKIITEIRLPFTMNTLLYGAAMGVAGVLLQRATRFTGICPSTSGSVAAGLLVITTAILIFELQTEWVISLIGILGAAFGLLLTHLFSRVIPIQAQGMRYLVGGLITSGVLGMLLYIVLITWGQENSLNIDLQSGLFQTGSTLIPISLICLCLVFCLSSRMNRSAKGDPVWLGVICIGVAIVLTGTAITTLGSWGMIGLIASNAARWLSRREDYRILLPVAAMIGGVTLSLLNTVSYLISPPFQVPLQIVISFIGIPVLVLLVWKEALRYARASEAGHSPSNSVKEITNE